MGIFNSLNVSATGLTAERLRMDIISKNIANAETTRTSAGTPYRRQLPIFREKVSQINFEDVLNGEIGNAGSAGGVEVVSIEEDQTDFKKLYNPGHPDANEEGYVMMPNVEIVTEMINLISAQRAYDANVTAINDSKNMMQRALEIGS
ncbi:MAG: flagellar basal body rod protein FlgC [Firmicutes bacterium]|jgi:flagellar basal-body rod protein FlgC|nr:flagellar basal body rod protein FlgC [Bacillota bacterium]